MLSPSTPSAAMSASAHPVRHVTALVPVVETPLLLTAETPRRRSASPLSRPTPDRP